MGKTAVGNDLNAGGKDIVIITGANMGGKSTFLCSVGLAHVMMQAGMFVSAESFASEPSMESLLITSAKKMQLWKAEN